MAFELSRFATVLTVCRAFLCLTIFGMAVPWAYAGQEDLAPDRLGRLPTRVLFVGNSYLYYNDGVYTHLKQMVLANRSIISDAPEFHAFTHGGARLVDHNISEALKLAPNGRGFDVLVLQENSTSALSQNGQWHFQNAVRAQVEPAKKQGGIVALYMTPAHIGPSRYAQTGMFRDIETMFLSTAKEMGLMVIPVGLAFEQAYQKRPELRLHHRDGTHPSPAGTYLAACVLYGSLFGRSPVGNPYSMQDKVDTDGRSFLQTVAAATVEGFVGRKLPRP
jgi:hypothetical protein